MAFKVYSKQARVITALVGMGAGPLLWSPLRVMITGEQNNIIMYERRRTLVETPAE